MAAFVSTFTDIGLINTTTNAGTITLPSTTQIPYRQLIFKDAYGNVPNRFLTLSTQGGDLFEDGRSTRVLKDAYGFTTLYGYNGTWYFLGGTTQNATTISSLTVSTINNGAPIRLTDLQSSIRGLGSASFVSSSQLTSTLGNFVSTLSLLSTVAGLNLAFTSPQNISSLTVSTGSLTASSINATILNVSSSAFVSSLIVNSLQFGDGTGWVNVGPIQTVALSSIQINTNTLYSFTVSTQQLNISSLNGDAVITRSNVVSTVQGLGSSRYISSAQLISTTAGLIDIPELLSTVQGLGSAQYISSAQLISTTAGLVDTPELLSTVQGLGSANYISSAQLLSSMRGVTNTDGSNFRSTTVGLGSSGYISSLQLVSSMAGVNSQLVSSMTGVTNTDAANFRSTTLGLGSSGYISSLQLISSMTGVTNTDGSNFTSTIKGLGSSGYISSLQLLSTVGGLQAYISSFIDPAELASSVLSFISTAYLTSQFTSTVTGLGSAGYVSTSQLVSTTSNLLALDTQYRTSTTIGLGTLQYISSAQLLSTVGGLQSYISSFIDPAELASSVLSFISTGYLTNQLTSTVKGLGSSGYISTAQLVSTTAGLIDIPEMQSTVQGLGSAQYISSAQLLSTVGGLQTYISSFIDPAELASSVLSFISTGYLTTQLTSTVRGLGSSGYISSAQLVSTTAGLIDIPEMQSTVQGLGSSGYISTSQLVSTTAGLIDIPEMQSTVRGLGSAQYISSAQLLSTVGGLQSYISSFIDPTELASSVLGFISTGYLTTQLTSTVQGLGSSGYISSLQLLSTVGGLQSYISSFIDPAELASSVLSFISTAYLTTQLTSTVRGLGSSGYISTAQLVSTTAGLIDLPEMQSTVQGLGSAQYISSAQLLSTVGGLQTYISSFIDPAELASSVLSFVSTVYLTTQLTSTVTGLGSAGYISSSQLLSTTASYANTFETLSAIVTSLAVTTGNISSLTVNELIFGDGNGWASFGAVQAVVLSSQQINTGQLYATSLSSQQVFVSSINGSQLLGVQAFQSTVTGLGTSGYISTSQLISTTSGLSNFTGLSISSFSTAFGPGGTNMTTITSTVAGLGSAGYLSSFNALSMSTSRINTSTLIFVDINSQMQQTLYVSTGVLLLNGQPIGTGGGTTGVTQSEFVTQGKLAGDQTLAATTTVNVDFVDQYDPQSWYNATTKRFQPTLAGYYLLNFQARFNVVPSNPNQNNIQILYQGANSIAVAQTPQYTTSEFFLSIAGKLWYFNGSSDYVTFTVYNGNGASQTLLQGTGDGAGTYFSAVLMTNGLGGQNLISTTIGLGSSGYISTLQLTSTVSGIFGTDGSNFTSTLKGLGSSGYISSAQLVSTTGGLVTFTAASISSFSTAFGPGGTNMTTINSTVQGLGSAQYISSAQLLSTVGGLQTYISSFIDPTELASSVLSFISTGYLATQLTSTVRGLGSASYVSTASLVSTTQALTASLSTLSTSYGTYFQTRSANISSLTVSSVTGTSGTISSLIVNSLQFGDGTGWASFGALQAGVLSSQQVNTGLLYATNWYVGTVSTLNAIQFNGLFGNYNNTAIAEISTGAGTQELLLFKGSSPSDRIRFTTTGDIRFEPQVASQLFANNPALTTPTMILQSNLVGIATANPGSMLDVAGQGRFLTLSSQALFVSSIIAPSVLASQFITF